mgnify:CR=1 FL=1
MSKKFVRKVFFVTYIIIVIGMVTAGICFSQEREITATYMASGTYDVAAKELVPEFERLTGIKVKIAAFPWAILREKNMTDLITGTGKYDVMSGSYYLAKVYEFFYPMDKYITKDNYGISMISGLMKKCQRYEGYQIGVPYGPDAYSLLYRTDLFKKAGIGIPQTWDAIIQAAKKLDTLYEGEGIDGYVFSCGAIEQLPIFLFAKYNGTFITADNKYHLEPREAIQAIKKSKKLLEYAPPGVLGLSIDEANAVFLQGKAAMVECWPSFIRAAANDPARSNIVGKWAILPYPKVGFPWLSMWEMFISRYSKDKDAAWEWIKFYTREKNAKYFFTKYGIGSAYTSTYQDPELLKKYGHDFPGILANLKRAKNPPLTGEAQDFLASTISQVLVGEITPEKAVENINTKWASLEVPKPLIEMAENSGLKAK